tara:strand:+ start:8614 stop:8832 length:219 start_codon:yes stop_codon:yes gene_type:complete
MEAEVILAFLASLWEPMKWIFMGLGILVVALRMIVKATPTMEDDKVVAKIDAIPIVGPLLAGLASRAPKVGE